MIDKELKKHYEDQRDYHASQYRYFQKLLNEIAQEEYDDRRVYRTNERQLDTRIDGCTTLQNGSQF